MLTLDRIMESAMPSMTALGATVRRAISAAPKEVARHGSPLIDRLVATGGPDRLHALEQYRQLARSYDTRTSAGAPYRRRTVERLAPAPGEVIVDVGCGTGLNFAAVQEGIGPDGRLIGIDLCPEMLERAQARVEDCGWQNVQLVQAAADEAQVSELADAVLLCGIHDVMRSPAALANILRQLRAGGRIVSGGARWAPWWRPGSVALNLSTLAMNRGYVTTVEGFERPWSHLADLVGDLQVEDVYFGGGYIAWGVRGD
jgi:ubiquinone/menaquinone biosynthesis C-methylase UbiE